MIEKIINIDNKQVKFKSSAAIPRLYRLKFSRDIYRDLALLEKDLKKENFNNFSLEVFENIAYIMAKHGDEKVPNTVTEWLDGFNTFSIYEVLPQILELWGLNTKTIEVSKKKSGKMNVR